MSTNSKPSIHVFSSTLTMQGAAMAIGKHHSSWYLCFPKPFGQSTLRAYYCLNYIQVHSPQTFPAPSPSGNPRFVFNSMSSRNLLGVLEEILALKDSEGHHAIVDTGTKVGTLNVLEILVPDAELLHACARCGKWESTVAKRFLRCSGCRSRHYCSQKCQKDDWKPELHKGDCNLLNEGKEFEAEHRRQLHNNNWVLDLSIDPLSGGSSRDFVYGVRERPVPASQRPDNSMGFMVPPVTVGGMGGYGALQGLMNRLRMDGDEEWEDMDD